MHELIEQVHHDRTPRLLERRGIPIAVVSPPSPAPMDQRELVAEILELRKQADIRPRTAADLIHQVREDEQEAYGTPR